MQYSTPRSLYNYIPQNNEQDFTTSVIEKIPYFNRILGYNRYSETKQVKSVTFQLTEDCNLRCSYCYQINKSKSVLDLEVAKKFIDLLLSDDTSKSPTVNKNTCDFIILDFIGGEPFLQVELMGDIVSYFIKRCIELNHPWARGYMISLSTNGTLYFTDKVQKFIKKYKNKLSVNITVDGNKELHDSCRVFEDGSGSYDLASAAVLDWNNNIQKGVGSRNTKITIAPQNVMYLKDAILNMIDLGFEYIHANCVYEDVWDDTIHPKILYDQLVSIGDYLLENDLEQNVMLSTIDPLHFFPLTIDENKNWCGGDGSMLALDTEGNIFNCVRYMKSSLGGQQEPLVIGNVWDGIATVPKFKRNLELMQSISRRSQTTDKCFWCPISKGCAYCSAYNYQLFGTPDKRTTTTCGMHTAASLAAVYYWNKVMEKHNDSERYVMMAPKEWAVPIIGEEEYDKLLKLSKSEPIYEDKWYKENAKPVRMKDGRLVLAENEI